MKALQLKSLELDLAFEALKSARSKPDVLRKYLFNWLRQEGMLCSTKLMDYLVLSGHFWRPSEAKLPIELLDCPIPLSVVV